jgi:hypothetical protein
VSPHGDAASLRLVDHESYLTANVGGGIKWFSTHGFDVRADYRML